jgi:alpha-L-fucosidase
MIPTSRHRTLALMAIATIATCSLPARADLAALQRAYVNQDYGLFLHFNMSTFTGDQWSNPNLNPDTFTLTTSTANPTGSIQVATDQWAATAKAAGMRYGVLTTKHHDGFALWNTNQSSYDIAATTWYNNPASPNYHVDVVQAYADSFRAQGLNVGLYYSIWDLTNGINAAKTDAEATAYVKAEIGHLLTAYGPISVLWTDGWGWQVGYTHVDYAEVYAHIKAISPDTLLLENNPPNHNLDHGDIAAYEQSPLPPTGNTVPSEVAATIASDNSWFYNVAGAATLKSASAIAEQVLFCNANQCTYLLNVPPGQDGMIPANMVQRLADIQAYIPPTTPGGTQIVNVQYYSTGGGQGQNGNASMTGQQGIVASTDPTPYWNQFTAAGYGWIPNPSTDMTNQILYRTDDSSGLVDSGIRLSGSRAQSVVRSSTGIPLFRGGIYAANGDGGTSLTFTLSGLTVGQSYDLHVYSAGPTFYSGNSLITVTGSAVTSTSTVWNSGITTYTAQNTASFPGIFPTAGGLLTIVASNPTQYFGINGMSLVQTVAGVNAYDTWASGLTDPAFDADPNSDGIENGTAWILGASGAGDASDNLLKVPAVSRAIDGALLVTFDCLKAAAPIAPLVAQYGDDLDGWTNFPVPTTGGTATDGNLSIHVELGGGSTFAYNRVTATIPAAYMALHPNTFFRLQSVK